MTAEKKSETSQHIRVEEEEAFIILMKGPYAICWICSKSKVIVKDLVKYIVWQAQH